MDHVLITLEYFIIVNIQAIKKNNNWNLMIKIIETG